MDNNIELSNQQKHDIEILFMTFDKDGDGKITNFEVAEALQAHHKDRTKDEIGYMMRILDLDCNKVIEFNEFLEMASLFEAKQNHGVSHLQIRQLFRAFDKDGNGVLSTSEIKQLWNIAPSDERTKKLSDAEMNEMIKAIDTNGDGQIDYEEFVTLMTS